MAFFSDDENKIEGILQVNQSWQNYSDKEDKQIDYSNLDINPRWSFRRTIVRNAFFRISVVRIYENRCAFCGLKVIKNGNQNIVDGAHIKPFSQFYDSRIHNGISLCKNHHWAFDMGWFSVDNQYKIIISNDLEEVSPHAKPMKDFHGEKLLLPKTEQLFPEMEALEWHRQNIFKA
ncbi:HNH endonuclease [Cylindrospermum sp. FACHB-282]|uniref:HNH endonuclease n=1 Tax=Cylindrospermum sp. FACHB-282 TaxID=2692794 RepID=UPI002815FB2E|nr:HNH endonuclease [Cylindrospermum sp. FACHB-282]